MSRPCNMTQTACASGCGSRDRSLTRCGEYREKREDTVDDRKKKQLQFSLGYVLIALLGMWLFQSLIFAPMIIRMQEVPYSQFRQELANANIDTVTLQPDRILYTCCTPPEGDQTGQVYNT
ncbi:MAG: hypothetical protein FJZ90_07925, partial [Chloroflexi bacterium]|nr:hypothetical protein [Chloroflexota bacterium]